MKENKRLFIAMDLNSVHGENLLETQRRLKKELDQGFLVPRENFHMTLAFLGEQDEAGQKSIEEAMDQVAHKTAIFLTYMSSLGYFSFDQGNTLYMGIKENEGLMDLVTSLKEALSHQGFPIEERPFKPHITLVKKAKLLPKVPSVEALASSTHLPKLPILVDKLILFESHLSKEGARYEKCYEVPLLAKRLASTR